MLLQMLLTKPATMITIMINERMMRRIMIMIMVMLLSGQWQDMPARECLTEPIVERWLKVPC